MRTKIRRLHTRYLIAGSSAASAQATARLDDIMRQRLPEALGHALERKLAGADTVYVLRRVKANLVLNSLLSSSDLDLVSKWADAVSDAVVRVVSNACHHGSEVLRFTDQAEFIAGFISDLFRGVAWSRWYYSPFSQFRRGSTEETIRDLLLQESQHLPRVLAHLHREGVLETLLNVLSAPSLQMVWSCGLGGSSGPREGVRSLFNLSLRLSRDLELGRASPRPPEALFEAYTATNPLPPDWRDQTSLAAVVLDILYFLTRIGAIARPSAAETETFTGRLSEVLAGLDWLDTQWLKASLSDWPTRPSEDTAIWPAATAGDETCSATTPAASHADGIEAEHMARPESSSEGGSPEDFVRLSSSPVDNFEGLPLPGRPTHFITPRLRQLLQDLAASIEAERTTLVRKLDSPANSLRLFAALVARFPDWARDPLATHMINRLLEALAALAADRGAGPESPDDLDNPVRDGNQQGAGQPIELALASLPFLEECGVTSERPRTISGHKDSLASACDGQQRAEDRIGQARQFLRSLGEPGAILVRALSDLAPVGSLAPGCSTESRCAGVFVLLRALLDVRLPHLVESTKYPPIRHSASLPAFLLAMGLRCAGDAGLTGDQIDPGLILLAGAEEGVSRAALADLWQEASQADHLRFQTALLEILVRQRMVGGSALHLFALQLPSGLTGLVAADQMAELAVLSRILSDATQIREVVSEWLNLWKQVTGQQASLVTTDRALANELGDGLVGVAIVPPRLVGDGLDAGDEPAAAHLALRQTLLSALQALDHSLLGAAEADLVLALTSIALLRLWARWLRQFANSSVPYLLENFIRRRGRLHTTPDSITVELDPRPLDIVMHMAGYTAELENVAWLGRRVRFQIKGL
jgi:hypothetical protein